MAASFAAPYYQTGLGSTPIITEAWGEPLQPSSIYLPSSQVISQMPYSSSSTTYPSAYAEGGVYQSTTSVPAMWSQPVPPYSPTASGFAFQSSYPSAGGAVMRSSSGSLDTGRDVFFQRLAQPKPEVKQVMESYIEAPAPLLHKDLDDRATTVSRLLAPKDTNASAINESMFEGSVAASDYVPIHRTWEERAETVDRLLAPKPVSGPPEREFEQLSAPSRRLTQQEMEDALTRLYRPKLRANQTDVYDQSKALQKEILNFRDGKVPKPKARRPRVTSPSGKMLKDPLAMPVVPGMERSGILMTEQQIQLTHDRLFQDAKEMKRTKELMRKEKSRPIPSLKLAEPEIKEVTNRLTVPPPPPRYFDEHSPERLVMAPGEVDRLTERLTKPLHRKAPAAVPPGVRTDYPKYSEEQIERAIDRLTRQPKRYELAAKKEAERKRTGGTGAGITHASGPWMAGIVTSQ